MIPVKPILLALPFSWILGILGLAFQLQERASWLLPVAVLCVQIGCAIAATIVNAPRGPLSTVYTLGLYSKVAACVIVLLGIALHLHDIRLSRYWTSEHLIAEDARWILAGNFINPFRNSGDFPTSFMSYIAAIGVALFEDVRIGIRIIGVISLLLFALLSWYTTAIITHRLSAAVLALPFLSLWLINLSNTADNNWLCVIPLHCAALFAIYSLLVIRGATMWIPLFALLTAVAVWTLYMPAIYGVVIAFLFLLEPKVSRKARISYLLWTIPYLLPLLGRIVSNPQLHFGRQMQFLGQAGEGKLNLPMIEGYLRTLGVMIDLSIPSLGRMASPDRRLLLEAPLLVFICIGCLAVIYAKWDRLLIRRLVVILVAVTTGVVLSNPVESFWRTTVMIQPLFMFANLGIVAVCTISTRPLVQMILTGVVLITLTLGFWQSYQTYRERLLLLRWSEPEGSTIQIYEQCQEALIRAPCIAPHKSVIGYLLRSLSRQRVFLEPDTPLPCGTVLVVNRGAECAESIDTVVCRVIDDSMNSRYTICHR